MARVSGVVLTKNEEGHIRGAIASLSWCDEIVVVDSESTDGTCQIAEANGARIVIHPFHNHGEQYNIGIDSATSEWIFLLDADERVTVALADEIRRELQRPRAAAFYVPRRNYFFGRWLRFGGLYPDASIRLLSKGSARYEIRQAHPRIMTSGKVARLKEPLEHLAWRGVSQYMEKTNTYTSWYALVRLDEKRRGRGLMEIARSGVTPWHKLRDVTATWPARPFLRFVLTYLFRLGFLDGRPGFRLAVFAALNEYMASLKLEELESESTELVDSASRGESYRSDSN